MVYDIWFIYVSSAGHHYPPTSTGIMQAEIKHNKNFVTIWRASKKISDQFFHCASSRILDIDKLQQNMVTELPLYVWVPTISFSPLTDSFKYVCLWFMIVSKQALSYIDNKRCCFATQSVHRSKPFFFLQKSRITGSLQFLHCVVLYIFHCAVCLY